MNDTMWIAATVTTFWGVFLLGPIIKLFVDHQAERRCRKEMRQVKRSEILTHPESQSWAFSKRIDE